MIRFLRTFVGFLLASAALLAALIAAFAVIAMTLVWWREGHLDERDMALLRRAVPAAVVSGLCTWAGFRLAHGKRRPDEARRSSFTLVRSRDGRQEKFVAVFSAGVYLAFFGGWLWTRAKGEPWSCALQVAGWLGLVYLGLHLRILLHELGHLAAASFIHLNATTVRIGAGLRLWSTQTRRGLGWEWRLRPTGGWVEAHHRDEAGFRWRQFVFVAGGPMVDILLIITLWLMLYHHGASPSAAPQKLAPTSGDAVAFVLFSSLALSALIGLIPHRVTIDSRQFHSDGWWLAKLWFLPATTIHTMVFGQAGARVRSLWNAGKREQAREELATTLRRYPRHALAVALLEARLQREAKDFSAEATCLERGRQVSHDISAGKTGMIWAAYIAFQVNSGDLEAARASCAALLAPVQEPARRAEILNHLACLPLLHPGTRALLPDAQGWCEEALSLEPGHTDLLSTQGALLIEQEQAERGMAILREVFTQIKTDNGRGSVAFYLALAAHRLGRKKELRDYRRTASRFCTQPMLRGRLRAELFAKRCWI